MNPSPIGLELRDVSKTYPGGIAGIEGVGLTLESGGLLAVVGPSGSGKSTLLRSVAGLEAIDRGEIRIGGRRVDGLAPSDRGISLVFQNQAPYPYLSVSENLAFGLRARRRPVPEIRERVAEVASALGLDALLDRRPSTLSGGEKQRVALGRAMATRPALLLLDEPFSNLDGPLRAAARDDLIRWQRRWGVTTLIVTHDQAEALAIGDRVAVMDGGKIVQIGPPRVLYERPATRFVGRFLGNPPMNVLGCERIVEGGRSTTRLVGSSSEVSAIGSSGRVELGIRPEDVAIVEAGKAGDPGPRFLVPGRVDRVEFRGDHSIATVKTGDVSMLARLAPTASVSAGDEVLAEIRRDRAVEFDPDTGVNLDGPGVSEIG